ncbi:MULTISPECIES: hypothetical protein [unclassified Mycolicibacterium]|uniref:hypothetical protein n=1 Tax=unclassified Mycolicibacterium TaxID=2636767 RepID=UPI002ED9ACCA
MRLDDLCSVIDGQGFPSGDAAEHPDRQSVVAAREAITAAVRDDEFLVDCMARELDLLERPAPRRGLVPFYTLPGYGIRFAFGYWPPGSNAGAHEHTAWTITAVCRNELTVQTYDRDQSYQRQELVPKNRFAAPAGRVGFVYEPCIHDPRNPTNRWSLSLHVTSPRDGERRDDADACLPVLEALRARRPVGADDPYLWVQTARYRQALIREVARFLATTEVAASEHLLDRCRQLGSAATRRFVTGLGRLARTGPDSGAAPVLTITHRDLALSCRDVDGGVALGVETPDGWIEQLRMARVAREAVVFCTRTGTFDVSAIPGPLTAAERQAIAEALEEAGLFRMEPN